MMPIIVPMDTGSAEAWPSDYSILAVDAKGRHVSLSVSARSGRDADAVLGPILTKAGLRLCRNEVDRRENPTHVALGVLLTFLPIMVLGGLLAYLTRSVYFDLDVAHVVAKTLFTGCLLGSVVGPAVAYLAQVAINRAETARFAVPSQG